MNQATKRPGSAVCGESEATEFNSDLGGYMGTPTLSAIIEIAPLRPHSLHHSSQPHADFKTAYLGAKYEWEKISTNKAVVKLSPESIGMV